MQANEPIRLNFGCGGNILPGWQNLDTDCDLEKLPLPFTDRSADQIFIEHCLEHFPAAHALALLDEFYRILKPYGTLRVCVPVLDRLTPAHARDIITGHGHRAAFSTTLIKSFMVAAGFDYWDVHETKRADIDGHHREIGVEKDDLETARIEARKL